MIKEQVSQALLTLIQKGQPLAKITVSQLLKQAKISRQTFYNHFLDKDDLIQYIYTTKILGGFAQSNQTFDFCQELTQVYEKMQNYRSFMQQACLLTGPNSLKAYMFKHCEDFDLKWHQHLYGPTSMPEKLVLATKYHATASSSMTLSWILADFPTSSYEMAKLITQMRSVGMEQFLGDKNPYVMQKFDNFNQVSKGR